MADDVRLNPGTGGDLVAFDDLTNLNGNVVTGPKIQRVKLCYGDDNSARDISVAWPLPITTTTRSTYRAATSSLLVTATTANIPFFIIQGSATKTIKVQSILVSGVTLTAIAYMNMGLAKFSTAPTGGTATTLTKVPVDSSNTAASANLVQVYTAVPTAGTKVGDVGCRRQMGQATTAAAAGIPEEILFDFSDNKEGSTLILRGTAEGLGLYWITAPASAPSMLLRVEWCEE